MITKTRIGNHLRRHALGDQPTFRHGFKEGVAFAQSHALAQEQVPKHLYDAACRRADSWERLAEAAYSAPVQQEPESERIAKAVHQAREDARVKQIVMRFKDYDLALQIIDERYGHVIVAPVQQEHIHTDNKQTLVNALSRIDELEAQNKQLLEALKVADKALRWVETTAASRAWDIVRAAIAAVEGKR